MDFDLKRPCQHCPFRTDCLKGWLGRERAREIADSILRGEPFPCHETTVEGEDGEHISSSWEQHCAGSMILLEGLGKNGMPNQLMHIAERLGLYDRHALDMAAPVFGSAEDFIDHHDDGQQRGRRSRRK
jgi:hypothetical protein